MKLKLADHSTALLPLTPTGAGALVIKAPVIIAAQREYFEMLRGFRLRRRSAQYWARAGS